VTRLRFVDDLQPPTLQVLFDGGDKRFVAAIAEYVAALRLPCLHDGPFEMLLFFDFKFEGEGKKYVLKDLDLSGFLGAVKPIPTGSAYFDTTTMKCPFDVRLTFKQPFAPNRVDELEDDVPARHAFIDWLASLEINVGDKPVTDLIGQPMNIHVPCATIDL